MKEEVHEGYSSARRSRDQEGKMGGQPDTIDLTDSRDNTPQASRKKQGVVESGERQEGRGSEGDLVATVLEFVPSANASHVRKLLDAQPAGIPDAEVVERVVNALFGEGGGQASSVQDTASMELAKALQEEWDGTSALLGKRHRDLNADAEFAASMGQRSTDGDGDLARELQAEQDHALAMEIDSRDAGQIGRQTRIQTLAECEANAAGNPEYIAPEVRGVGSATLLDTLARLIEGEQKGKTWVKEGYLCRCVTFYGSVGRESAWDASCRAGEGGDRGEGEESWAEAPQSERKEGDAGWGCGYRNIQMMASHLLTRRTPGSSSDSAGPYKAALFAGASHVVPVKGVQAFIEQAWSGGYDPQGAEQLGNALIGTEKWIGTTEAQAMLRSMGVRAKLAQFKTSTAAPATGAQTHDRLWTWVRDYFREGVKQAPAPSGKMMGLSNKSPLAASSRPPLYLQYQGHSFTIVGCLRTDKVSQFLVLDPGVPPGVLESCLSSGRGWQRLTKRGVHTFRQNAYQVLYVEPDGLLPHAGEKGFGGVVEHPLGVGVIMDGEERREVLSAGHEVEYTDGKVSASVGT